MIVKLYFLSQQASLEEEINQLKTDIEELTNKYESERSRRSSLEGTKVSLEVRMAEIEEQKEGI